MNFGSRQRPWPVRAQAMQGEWYWLNGKPHKRRGRHIEDHVLAAREEAGI
jgi:hypothetical protein